MSQTQTTGIIRQRGQLTIPELIRSKRRWAKPGAVVEITTDKAEEITIRPYSTQKQTDWKTLWKEMRKVRAFKGKNKKSLSSFIAADRLKGHSI